LFWQVIDDSLPDPPKAEGHSQRLLDEQAAEKKKAAEEIQKISGEAASNLAQEQERAKDKAEQEEAEAKKEAEEAEAKAAEAEKLRLEKQKDKIPTTPGVMESLNRQQSELSAKLLETKKEPTSPEQKQQISQLKKEVKDADAKLQALMDQHVQREKPGKEYEHTWPTKGDLGMRLQDTPMGVMVSFMSPDADHKMPCITGMVVQTVNGTDVDGYQVKDVVKYIRGIKEWPLTIRFVMPDSFDELDEDGDGIISEEEFKNKFGDKEGQDLYSGQSPAK